MNIWLEIEYVSKDDGAFIHSDVCIHEKDFKHISKQLFSEIIELSDLTKPWSVHSNGKCTIHNHD